MEYIIVLYEEMQLQFCVTLLVSILYFYLLISLRKVIQHLAVETSKSLGKYKYLYIFVLFPASLL